MKFKYANILLILIFLCFACFQAKAQKTGEVDIVSLKDGSIYRGRVLEVIPDSIVKIEIFGGNVRVLQMHEVASITKESRGRELPKGLPEIKTKGYYNVTEIGFLAGNLFGFIATTSHGYQFMNPLSIGGGVGILLPGQRSSTLLPVYLELRGNLLKRRITPYYNLRSGYGIELNPGSDAPDMEENLEGGWFFLAGAGVKFDLNAVRLFLSLNYSIQQASFRYSDSWGGEYEEAYSYNRLGFLLGMGF